MILGLLSALGPASMDIYIPALPTLQTDFGTTASTAQLTVGVYLFGLGTGQLISGPLSDVFGRRRPMLAAIVVYCVASLACAAAPSIELLIAGRLLQGASAAAGIVISRAIVRDLFWGPLGARYLSRLVLIYGIAPVIAPIVGSQILRLTSWRGVFLTVAALGVLTFIAATRVLPETLPPERRRPGSITETREGFAILLRDRAYVGYVLALGFGSGAVIGYIAGSPFLLQEIYGVSPTLFGLFLGVNAAAMVAASQINAHVVTRLGPARLLTFAIRGLIVAGLVFVAAIVFDLGFPIVAPCLLAVMCTWGFIPSNGIALAQADHPQIAGTASALAGAVQFGLGALAAPAVGVAGATTALPMALVVLACGLLAIAMLRFVVGRREPILA